MQFNNKTSKICLVTLCLLCISTVGLPQFDGATFFMEEEIWKDIPGFEGQYQLSSSGRVKNVKSNRFKSIILRPSGLKIAKLYKCNKEFGISIDRYKYLLFGIFTPVEIENLPNEEWKQITHFGKNYFISSCGRLKNMRIGLIKSVLNRGGYLCGQFSDDGKRMQYRIHRLVGIYFIPNPENKPCINHKNGIKTDNRIENLEWCTSSENNKHAHKLGLNSNKGERHPQSILTLNNVKEIRTYQNTPKIKHELAKKFGVCFMTIHEIMVFKSWKDDKAN